MMKWVWLGSAVALAVLAVQPQVSAQDGFYIRPHLQNITKDAVTIIWETPEAGVGAVEYGPDTQYGQEAKEAEAQKIHRVRITGLEPETAYHYQVKAGEEVLESTFKTAPATDRPITFVLIGDSRRWENRWEETKMQEHVAKWKPEFYLTMGDLVVRGHNYELWPEHFKRFDGVVDRLAMVTARGNHEGSQIFDPEQDWFAKYHELPGEGEPYSGFEWGNTWIGLISYEATAASPKWIHEALPKVDKKYKILAHHFPVYCSGYQSPDDERKEMGTATFKPLADAIDEHDIDLDLAGHTHIYERSHRITGGERDDQDGAVYIVNGGDIGGQYPEWYTAVVDDEETMDKPTYTVFHMGEDQIWFRTFVWGKAAEEIIEIDYKIIPQTEELAEQTLAKLASASGEDLVATIETLGAIGVHEAAQPLLAHLKGDNEAVREAAATALRRIGIAEPSPAFVEYLQDENLTVRRELARALEIAMKPELVEQLIDEINDPQQDERVRQCLIGALEFHAPAEFASEQLLALLKQPETPEKVRERAAYALGRTATEASVQELAALFKDEPSEYVAVRLAFTLNRLTGERQPLNDKSPLFNAKPGAERQEFVDKWLQAEGKPEKKEPA